MKNIDFFDKRIAERERTSPDLAITHLAGAQLERRKPYIKPLGGIKTWIKMFLGVISHGELDFST